jgi:hypothetical protein
MSTAQRAEGVLLGFKRRGKQILTAARGGAPALNFPPAAHALQLRGLRLVARHRALNVPPKVFCGATGTAGYRRYLRAVPPGKLFATRP